MHHNIENGFQSFASEYGYTISQPRLDGAIHRFNTKRHKSSKSGWYWGTIQADGSYYAVIGDWSNGGEKLEYKSTLKKPVDKALLTSMRETVETAKKEFEKERIEANKTAKENAAGMLKYGRADIVTQSEYWKRKGLSGFKTYGALGVLDKVGIILYIPMIDPLTGEMWGVQEIYEDGTKLFQKGQRTKGTGFVCPGANDTIYICEGVATAITVANVTGKTTWAALSSNNLKSVAEAVAQTVKTKIVICADRDGVGLTAAQSSGFDWVAPKFSDEKNHEKYTDFNDLFMLEGREAVLRCITGGGKELTEKPTPKKRVKALLYRQIADLIDQHKLGNYYVVEPEPGVKSVLKTNSKQVVRYVGEKALYSDILRHSENDPKYQFTPADVKESALYWIYRTDPIDEPVALRFKSDPGLCFHRLPFDRVLHEDIKSPVWDEIMNRCSDAPALEAFIGSLFVPGSDRHQYLWLYGQGLNGKGAIIRFLDKCLGPSFFATETPKDKHDNFWTYRLMGKRLIALPDCADYKFPSSQKFKMLSGGDKIPVEPKGKQVFNVNLNCKFLFASNEKPCISGQKSDIRRAIFCELGPIGDSIDPHYEKKLWAEAPSIVSWCLLQYHGLCVDNVPIPTDVTALETLIAENESRFDMLFNEAFIVDTRTDNISEGSKWRFSRSELTRFFDEKSMREDDRKAFIKFLEFRYGIKFKGVKISTGGITIRAYVGAYVALSNLQDIGGQCSLRPST